MEVVPVSYRASWRSPLRQPSTRKIGWPMISMACSSFLKRRLGIASSRSVPLLDQLPETLLPLWGLQAALGTTFSEILVAVALFVVVDLLLSRLMRMHNNH